MRRFILLGCSVLAMGLSGPAAAQAPASDVTAVVQRHMAAFDRKDVEGLMADYGDDVVTVMSGQILHGKAAMRGFFTKYFAGASPKFDAKLDRVEGDTGVTLWVVNPGDPKAVQGNDVFVVRGGKIVFQATTGVKPVTPPKP